LGAGEPVQKGHQSLLHQRRESHCQSPPRERYCQMWQYEDVYSRVELAAIGIVKGKQAFRPRDSMLIGGRFCFWRDSALGNSSLA